MKPFSTPQLSSSRPSVLRPWLLWTSGFISFPLGGLIGTTVVGRIDNALAGLAGGAIAGLVIGFGQTLASNRRLQAKRWIPLTTVGMSVGLYLGATAVNFGTSLPQLALMGAISGLVLGLCQTLAFPRGVQSRWLWTAALPVLWATGWTVSTLFLVRVDEQFIVFGASGALVFAMLSGLVLHRILPADQPSDRLLAPVRGEATP